MQNDIGGKDWTPFGFENFYMAEKMFMKAETDAQAEEAYAQVLYMVSLNLMNKFTKEFGANEIPLREIPDTNMMYILAIAPMVRSAEELEIPINETTIVNMEAAIKYTDRIRREGPYKSRYYHIKALTKVFPQDIIENKTNTELVKLDRSREYINSEASDIGLLMLNAISEDGELIKEYSIIENKGHKKELVTKNMVFIKKGKAVSDQALNLLHYLIGEIEDNVCNNSNATGMKFYKTEFCGAIKKDLRGKKWGYIADLVLELQQVQYRILTKEEYEHHIKTRQRMKAIPLFSYKELDINGDDIKLEFDIPLIKYLRGISKFKRDIDRGITGVMFSKPRIYKIARYAVMESFRNSSFVERKIDTLIESIGETEKYINNTNKRRYLYDLYEDVNRANKFLINGVSIKMDKCNQSTKEAARVSISGTSKLRIKNKSK